MERTLKMSELAREEMAALMTIISTHCVTRLRDGAEAVFVTDKVPGKIAINTIAKHLKTGWILSKDYEQNIDTIAEWKRVKVYISDMRTIIRIQTALVMDTQEDIILIESGDLDEKMLPGHKENLEKWQESLVTKRCQLKKAKVEFKSLKAAVKALKNKFKLYLSQLEAEG